MSNLKLRGLDPRLDEILKDTYYQLIYQEQVTEIAMKLAGYTAGEADLIRKTIGRKIQSELNELVPSLIKGFVKHGMEESKAELLAEAIQACGGYIFNKAHSVEYGLIAWQTAYLKANFPVEYMCSLLNANMDKQEEALPYIDECKRIKIDILPPSVKAGNLRFVPEGNAIRVGLSYIKNINNIKITYSNDIQTFFEINGYDKRIKEALIKSGALDCFGISRQELMAIAFNLQQEMETEKAKIEKATQKIIDKNVEISKSKEGTKKVAQLYVQIENQKKAIKKSEDKIIQLQAAIESNFDEIQGELDTLGFTFQDIYSRYETDGYDVYSDLKTIRQKIIVNVVEVKNIKDRNNKPMAFIKGIPYKGEQTEFVMFASNYVPVDIGMYVFEVKNKNQVIGVAKAKKKAA